MKTAVVHLVRNVNGPDPLARFLASYREHDAGGEHELVLLLKGFDSVEEAGFVRRLAGGLGVTELHVSDAGVDLTAYLDAAQRLDHDRLCFLNSFSVIRSGGWLGLLQGAAESPGAGLVGATASWASNRAGIQLMLRLPTGHRGALGSRDEVLAALAAVNTPGDEQASERRLHLAHVVARTLLRFPGFPAPHLRTNAFLVERRLLLDLVPERISGKDDAYMLESGHRSLTSRVEAAGLRVLAVGADGVARLPADWPDADLFWQARQEDLLVADNQTAAYARAEPSHRAALSRFAWGSSARPG